MKGILQLLTEKKKTESVFFVLLTVKVNHLFSQKKRFAVFDNLLRPNAMSRSFFNQFPASTIFLNFSKKQWGRLAYTLNDVSVSMSD